jgi:hypothetical protein
LLPLVTLAMLLVTSAMVVGGLMAVWPRRWLAVKGDGLEAYTSRGIGAIDLTRRYVRFAAVPGVRVEPRRVVFRGRTSVASWLVIVGDGAAELTIDAIEEARARELAERVVSHLAASSRR